MTRVIVEIRETEIGAMVLKSFAARTITSTGREMEAAKQYIDRFDQLMRDAKGRVVKKNALN